MTVSAASLRLEVGVGAVPGEDGLAARRSSAASQGRTPKSTVGGDAGGALLDRPRSLPRIWKRSISSHRGKDRVLGRRGRSARSRGRARPRRTTSSKSTRSPSSDGGEHPLPGGAELREQLVQRRRASGSSFRSWSHASPDELFLVVRLERRQRVVLARADPGLGAEVRQRPRARALWFSRSSGMSTGQACAQSPQSTQRPARCMARMTCHSRLPSGSWRGTGIHCGWLHVRDAARCSSTSGRPARQA